MGKTRKPRTGNVVRIDWRQIGELFARLEEVFEIKNWGPYLRSFALVLLAASALYAATIWKLNREPGYVFCVFIGAVTVGILLAGRLDLRETVLMRNRNRYRLPYADAGVLFKMGQKGSKPSQNNEKRVSERRDLQWETSFESLDGRTQGVGYALNAGAQGVGFSSDCAFEPGQLVNAFFRQPRLRSVVEVRWPTSLLGDGRFRNGGIVHNRS